MSEQRERIEPPAPGVYRGISMDTYRAWDAASNSALSRLMRSPAHMKAYLDEPSVDTPALALGRAIHSAVLEPDLFRAEYTTAEQCKAVKGDGERCTNSGVFNHRTLGWVCGVHVRGHDRDDIDDSCTVLSAADHEVCSKIGSAVLDHPKAQPLITGEGDVELSIVWRDEKYGVLCKARWDRHSPGIAGGAIVDLKTTRDAGRLYFERAIFNLKYHNQAAFYLRGARACGLAAKHFAIIAVEKEPPYALAVYRITEGSVEAGAEVIDHLLRRYAECRASDSYPAYPTDIQDISIPAWAWTATDRQIDEITHGEAA